MEWSAYQQDIFTAAAGDCGGCAMSGRVCKDGELGYKTFTVRVIHHPDQHAPEKKVFRCQPGKLYTADGIAKLTDHVVEYLDKQYPYWEFRMVELGPDKVNFIYVGLREATLPSPSGRLNPPDGPELQNVKP